MFIGAANPRCHFRFGTSKFHSAIWGPLVNQPLRFDNFHQLEGPLKPAIGSGLSLRKHLDAQGYVPMFSRHVIHSHQHLIFVPTFLGGDHHKFGQSIFTQTLVEN